MRIISFDLETTGTDPAQDRIVQIGWVTSYEGRRMTHAYHVNPLRGIPPEATKVHGITDEDVRGAQTFREMAEMVHREFAYADFLVGYNILNFDIPLLWEEFNRAGIEWDVDLNKVVDVFALHQALEPRTLEALADRYLGRRISAHDAFADACATLDLLGAFRDAFPKIAPMSMQELSKMAQRDRRVDLFGRMVLNDAGEPIYNFGKYKGQRVLDCPSFGMWMLQREFPISTKRALRKILNPETLIP